MSDFSSYEGRLNYYEHNKECFHEELRKMWRIHWEIDLEKDNYTTELVEEYTNNSIEKVWLNREKKFDLAKTPKEKNLFTSLDWWFGQLVNKKNIPSVIKREKEKKARLENEGEIKQISSRVIEPFMPKIIETVLSLKSRCNNVMLAEWFQEDSKNPLIFQVFSGIFQGDMPSKLINELKEEFKMEIDDKILDTKFLDNQSLNIKGNKRTLLKVAVHFRFYYLGKNVLKDPIEFPCSLQKEVLQEAYMQPCPEGDLLIKDAITAKKLNLESKKLKVIRSTAVENVLLIGYEEQQALKDRERALLKMCRSIFDLSMECPNENSNKLYLLSIYAQRLWKYSNRNISEALRVPEEICEDVKENSNE